MSKSLPAPVKVKDAARVTRSISFERKLLAHVKKVAAASERTPNWVINDLVRKDLEDGSQ